MHFIVAPFARGNVTVARQPDQAQKKEDRREAGLPIDRPTLCRGQSELRLLAAGRLVAFAFLTLAAIRLGLNPFGRPRVAALVHLRLALLLVALLLSALALTFGFLVLILVHLDPLSWV
jgi:hypothetical protein